MIRCSLLLTFLLACGGSSSPKPATTAPPPAQEEAAPETAPEPVDQTAKDGQEAQRCWEDCTWEDRGTEDECREECGLAEQSNDRCFLDCLDEAENAEDAEACDDACD